VLTDNGTQFNDPFTSPRAGKVLFKRVCHTYAART
jgi:hypothetical protein